MTRTFREVVAAQRSPEWVAARVGRFTASRAGDMVATLKSGGEAAARRDLRLQLVCERLTGQPAEDDYMSDAMQRGLDLEAEARLAYEARTGQIVVQPGFLAHTTHEVGCSPDGVVEDYEGLVELKCPKSATHLRYLRANCVPTDYVPQMTHQLWVTGAQWVDFVSYDNRFPEAMRLYVARFHRDEAAISVYAEKALAFLAEVEREVAACRGWEVLTNA